MNCQNFETALDDLARGALMDARSRAAALAHCDSCHACAARLADVSALRAGLRFLAAQTEGAEAPARIESALLAAFRAQSGTNAGTNAGASACAPSASGNVVSLTQRTALRQWSWVKTFATAATAAAAAAILLMIIPPGMDAPADNSGGPRASKATPTQQTEESPAVAGLSETPPTVENSEDEPPRILNAPKSVPTARFAPASRGEGRTMATMVGYNTSGAKGSRAMRGTNAAALDEEIVTDFIALSHGGARLSAGDGGQLVRVELPRSALERFGLPMNVERANERIKADVLLGEDGMARAIRFVR